LKGGAAYFVKVILTMKPELLIAAVLIACAAEGDHGKIWDICQGVNYAFEQLSEQLQEQEERKGMKECQ
jgi:hypothetical protein